MSDLDKRRDAYETRFVHDADVRFKAEARCCKKVGLWAAEQIGLDEEASELYAKEVVTANLEEPGYDDIKRKITSDFADKKLEISEHAIDSEIERCHEEALKEIKSDS